MNLRSQSIINAEVCTLANNATYILTNEILEALNNKLTVGGIFCDLEKAIECINHKILLSKLEFYGVKGKAKLWFESYFCNRYQRTSITKNVLNWNYFSTWEEIEHGVLQGSILVSLFLFYINDLPKAINDKSIPILLAYDTSILNAELNPICHLLALLGAHHILHISRIRVNHKSKQKWLST